MKKGAIFLGLALVTVLLVWYATPAFAVDFKIHGNFWNRLDVTNNVEAIDPMGSSATGSKNNDFSIYYNDREYISLKSKGFPKGRGFLGNTDDDSGKDRGDSNNDHFWGESKFRMRFEFSSDDNMAKGVWAFEVGTLYYGQPDGSAGRGKGGGLSGDGVNTETRFLYTDFQNPLVSHTSRLRLGL
ncbi:MAG TPA: hypothetical protein ENI41_08635, partial [Deltaproteobacteria bacterium]|nr:hypothetical protein [Deltaproteobacteria bacterium]